ncbi:MAG: tol-pal system protein YbgF [Rhizobiaceae bacterium]|nr:tol-pal system protein YbgF [Rhizobiaceae bacterium]
MNAYSRTIALCFAVFLMPGTALAGLSSSQDRSPSVQSQQHAVPLAFSLPGFGRKKVETAPVILAQSGDDAIFRIGQLEERIRELNGRIEELGFQLLEVQENMRRMQEDNEFRFQELEGASGKRSDAGSGAAANDGKIVATTQSTVQPLTRSADTGVNQGDVATAIQQADPALEQPAPAVAQDLTKTASLPDSEPGGLYQAAYGYVLSGDYPQAEVAFNRYISQYPDGNKISDAYFWLGEAQYSQGSFHEAAKTLLTAHKQFPNAPKAPEMLLKLGMSLAALDNRDTACATYREVLTRYPGSSEAVKNKVAVEQSRMSC